ncbi:WD40 repeat domain-containing protein [Pararhizobium haloflavum]|uniref:WD40 repeat domain-containing protein n=1 Tax=Pararhizobium haloflavum TaxID=2037914 RepID=UPI000C19DF2A|nr:WD40 repeat domain-containing protein [Pararhizobium haloflavum]
MPTVAPLDLDSYCVAARFLADVPVFALADGTVHRLDHGHQTTGAHDGLLTADVAQDGRTLLTGGEDGRVVAHLADGAMTVLAEIGMKWIGQIAAGPSASVAFSSGRTAYVRQAESALRTFACPRTVEGLAFAPKGLRIAIARYNGVTLHWAGMGAKPTELEWKGSHTGVTFSPDGKFLVTTMQENALHGWRMADNHDMRMSGYPAKVKSLSWSAKGKWLASSGAPAAIVWPFSGKDGPMGKAPMELGTRADALVTIVACHPREDMVAIGFNDGMILASRFSDQKEVLLRRPGNGAISSLSWNKAGTQLAFGSEAGDCGVVDITA